MKCVRPRFSLVFYRALNETSAHDAQASAASLYARASDYAYTFRLVRY